MAFSPRTGRGSCVETSANTATHQWSRARLCHRFRDGRLSGAIMVLVRNALRVVAVASGGVAVGVATNQVLNGGKWNLRWLVGAIVLAVLAGTLGEWLAARGAAG